MTKTKIKILEIANLIGPRRLFITGVLLGVPLTVFFMARLSLPNVIAMDNTDEPWSIFIVAGQSNAEGTNSYFSNLPPGDQLGDHPADDTANPDDNAHIWWRGADGANLSDFSDFVAFLGGSYNNAGWEHSFNSDDPTMDGLINFKDMADPLPMGQRSGQFGSELQIARELYDQGRRKVIILKVTYGFQTLAKSTSQFVPFDWYPEIPGEASRNRSYQNLKDAYSELTQHLTNQGDTYTVDGFFWLQGESDTIDQGYTDDYEDNYDLLLNRVKEDFHFHPDAHAVGRKFNLRVCTDNAYPAIGNYCGFGYATQLEGISIVTFLNALGNPIVTLPDNGARIRTVRNAMQTVSDKYDWADVVETDDTSFANDYIHLNHLGQLHAGERMINMFEPPYRKPINLSADARSDYDDDGIDNSFEDNGRGANCQYTIGGSPVDVSNNGNLGDDDSDCDGFPDYLDAVNGPGSGLNV